MVMCYMCAGVLTYMHALWEAEVDIRCLPSLVSTLFLLVICSLTELGAHQLLRLVSGQWSSQICLFLPPSAGIAGVCPHAWLCTWIAGDLNSGPYVCVANTLSISLASLIVSTQKRVTIMYPIDKGWGKKNKKGKLSSRRAENKEVPLNVALEPKHLLSLKILKFLRAMAKWIWLWNPVKLSQCEAGSVWSALVLKLLVQAHHRERECHHVGSYVWGPQLFV